MCLARGFRSLAHFGGCVCPARVDELSTSTCKRWVKASLSVRAKSENVAKT